MADQDYIDGTPASGTKRKEIDLGGGYFARLIAVVIQAGAALLGKVQIRNAANTADIDPLAEATYTARTPALLGTSGGLKTSPVDPEIGSNVAVTLSAATAAWANNAPAGTTVTIDVTIPAALQKDACYEVMISNPSTESDLTVVSQNKETLNAIVCYPEHWRFAVVKNNGNGRSEPVPGGWLLGTAGRLSISNDTLIGAAGAFTIGISVRKV